MTPAGAVSTLAGSPGVSGSGDGSGGAAQFKSPNSVAVDSSGNVYVADGGNQTIRKVTGVGLVTTLAGSAGVSGTADGRGNAARFSDPGGVAVDGGGNVYVADSGNDTIRKVTPAGVVTTLAGRAGVSGTNDGTGSAAQFDHPQGLTVDGGGNVLVADEDNQTVRKVTPAGVVTTLAGTPGVSGTADGAGSRAQFFNPVDAAVDGNGNIYVADNGNETIRRVAPTGLVTTIAGTAGVSGTVNGMGTAARFYSPGGIAVDGNGGVYVADTGNERISNGKPQQVTGAAGGFNAVTGPVVNGAANPNGSAATVWFDYGTDIHYGSQTPPLALGSGTNFVSVSGTLSGVTLNAIYHYRLAFTGSAGAFYGEDRILDAPGYLAGAAVVSGTAVTFSASVDPNGGAGPSADKGNVLVSWQYGLAPGSYTAQTAATRIGTGTSTVPVTLTMGTGRLAAAIYHYRLVISSARGFSYGPDQIFSFEPPTLAYAAPAVTGTSAALSLRVNPNGMETTVSIQYGRTTACAGGTVSVGDIGSGFAPVTVKPGIAGLSPGRPYAYRVVMRNALGTTYGPAQEFDTLPLPVTATIVPDTDGSSSFVEPALSGSNRDEGPSPRPGR